MGFSLRQFSEVFKIRDATGQPYILIGGQAVNYWAERYRAIEPQLEALQPFTSEDIDFKGDQADVRRIATQLDLRPSFPPMVRMTALAGSIPIQISGLKSNIEVVRLPARDWLKVANQVLKLTTNQRTRKIAGQHQINWPEILPLSAIAGSQHEKIRRFQAQQLEKGFNQPGPNLKTQRSLI